MSFPLLLFGQTGPAGVSSKGSATNLVLWLDGQRVNSNNSNPTVGAAVSSWYDKSGRGLVLNQTASGVATYSATGVTFNNTGYLTASDAGFPAGTSARSALIVASSPSTNADDVFFFYGSSSTDQAYGILKIMNTSGTAPDGVRNFFYTDDLDVAGGWTPSGTLKIITTTFTSSTQNIYINNGAANTKTTFTGTPSTVLGGAGALQVGGWNSFTLYSQATIAEVILFNKVLNAAEQIIINNYLSAKYNLTLSSNDLYTMDNSGNGNYDYDVAGIGRATVSDTQTDAQGSGIVRINNVSGLNADGEYYMWGHNNGSLMATTTDIPTGIQARVPRVWRGESPAGTTLTSFDVTFDLSSYPSLITTSDLRLLVDTNNNGNFSDETVAGGGIIGPPTKSGTSYTFATVSASGSGSGTIMTSTHRFTLGTINKTQTTLPITLLEFTAEQHDNAVKLYWNTASEENNDFFTMERTTDGNIYELIGTLKGAGTSTSEREYTFIDSKPLEDGSYYRLTQTDFNGKKQSFPLAFINFKRIGSLFKVFPNPSSGEKFNLYLTGMEDSQRVAIAIHDVNGYQIYTVELNPSERNTNLSYTIIPPYELTSGIYFITINDEQERYVLKLIVK